MIFKDRQAVEIIGRIGSNVEDIVIGDDTDACVTTQLSSFYLCCKKEDFGLSEHFKHDGFWEAWVTLWISKNVKAGSVCIDAGANYGYYTFMLANMGCRVYAIEANPFLIPYIEMSRIKNGNKDSVIIINKAVSNVARKTVRLNLMSGSGNTTILNNIGNPIGTIETVALALDDVVRPLQKVDFVKMDIEGCEPLAWEGMQKLLKRNPQCVVLMEFAKKFYGDAAIDFFTNIFDNYYVGYVDYNGDEQPISSRFFIKTDTEEFRMLVIRAK